MSRKRKTIPFGQRGYWPPDFPRDVVREPGSAPAPERQAEHDPQAPWPHNGQPHPAYGPPETLPRDEHGRIPPAYYCTPAELALIETGAMRAERHDGFTADRQRIFLEALAAGAGVSEAADAASVSRKTVYARRNAPHAHAFRAAWDEAQRCALRVLADTAFDRAINGVEEDVWHQGAIVGRRTRYFERLMIHLLAVRDPLNYAPLRELPAWQALRGQEPPATLDAGPERLDLRLRAIAAARGGDPPEEIATLLPLSPLQADGAQTDGALPAEDGGDGDIPAAKR